MRADLLDVIGVYYNPVRWESRLRLHLDWERHMLDSGVRLTTVECQTGERPFELPDDPRINRVRVRTKTMLWNKERLINIGVSRLPDDWKYLCWCDADIEFRKSGWAAEAVQALQHYDIIQPWSDAYDLGPKDEHIQAHKSFCRMFWEGQPVVAQGPNWWKFDGGKYDYCHPGFSWAITRIAFEWLGGLIDWAILGAGDHHMALALVGQAWKSVPAGINPLYMKPLLNWQARALQHINLNIGFTYGTVEHRFHGLKGSRKYIERWDIITKNNFDPSNDLKTNSFGVYELAGNKPQLRLDIDHYFRQRNEDLNVLV